MNASPPPAVPGLRYVLFLTLTAGALFTDLYSKWWVFARLGYPYRSSDPLLTWLWGDDVFRLMTSLNHGALWGVGQGYSRLFAGLSVVAVAAVPYWLFVHGAARSKWLTVALGLIMAGTLGNLYDRLGLHGCEEFVQATGQFVPAYAVRDFLYFRIPLYYTTYDWPIFNFADVFLVTGAIMLVVHSIRLEIAESQAARDSRAAAAAAPPATTLGSSAAAMAGPSA